MTVQLSNTNQTSPLSPEQESYELGEREIALVEYGEQRLYYDGEQYEAENDAIAEQAGYTDRRRRLPEHLRKHSYSSHVGEAIDVLADMLAEGISFDGQHANLLNQWWTEAELDERADDWIREALVVGNVFAQPTYDLATETMMVNFWEAESIWPVYAQDDWRFLDHWYRFTEYVEDGIVHREKRIVVSEPVLEAQNPVFEVVEYVYVDDEYRRTERKRLPWFDLVHARGDTRHRVRSRWGDSMITKKVRGTSDRYNAIAQLGYRIARQNSFATVGVVGDAAFLGQGRRDEAIAKDVADVLSFPGGTNLEVITLPTDPRTMEWQIDVLEQNIYKEFGLVKTDMKDMTGMGTVSGYALEVLNRKERATHKRIRKNALAGLRDLANMMLDVAAIRQAEAEGTPWWMVNPEEVYPNRDGIKITIGSGDIVDAVSDRADFESGLVSRRYVLNRKGLTSTEITNVENEVYAEKERLAGIENELVLAREAQSQQHDEEMARIQQRAQLSSTGSTQTGTTQGG